MLRDTWGFDGFVVSDANAVRNLVTHGFAADLTDAAARAVNAGVDMEMAISDPAYAHLPEALESGAANPQAVDASVRRVLEAKIRMGLFDAPYVDEDRAREVLADPAHRDVARIAAERSAVLLRNEGDLLPLDAGQPELRSRSSGRWPTPSATPSGRGSSTSTSTRPSPCWKASAPGSATGVRVDHARGVARRATGVPVDVRHVRREQAARTPRGSTRRPSSSEPSTSRGAADVAVVVVG